MFTATFGKGASSDNGLICVTCRSSTMSPEVSAPSSDRKARHNNESAIATLNAHVVHREIKDLSEVGNSPSKCQEQLGHSSLVLQVLVKNIPTSWSLLVANVEHPITGTALGKRNVRQGITREDLSSRCRVKVFQFGSSDSKA